MNPGKRKIFVVFLIATLQVIILQAAPANDTSGGTAAATDPGTSTPSTGSQSTNASTTNESAATTGTSGVEALADEGTTNKPTPKPSGSKPTGGKPTNLTATKPSSGSQALGSCWTCLIQAVEEMCSYLTDWTSPKKIPTMNLFSLFHERSSEEDSDEMPSVASLFRFKRSDVDPAMEQAQNSLLDLLDGFYVKAREQFAFENPGLLIAGSDNLYNRPDEIAQVVAYVLGVPKDRLVEVFGKMETRRTGEILLQALGDRRRALSGEEQLENKSITSLNPTSISYFFKELFGSVNGVATGLSEIISIVLQNQNTNVKQN